MRKFTFGILAITALAGTASADITDAGWYVMDSLSGTARAYNGENDDSFSPRAIQTVYRNWAGTAPAGGADGALQGLVDTNSTAGQLNGDDTNILSNGANRLSGMGINIANLNAAGTRLATVAGTIQFFRQSDGGFIGGFNYNSNLAGLAGGGLDGGSSIRLSFADASLEALAIDLGSAPIYTTWSYDTATWANFAFGSISNLGIQVRNPIGIGTSTNSWINNGNVVAGPIGTFDANTSIFIRTTDVPAPGAVALLGLAGIFAGRRRR